jgi:hypothetical protein
MEPASVWPNVVVTFFVSEEQALGERAHDACAVDRHEGPRGPRTGGIFSRVLNSRPADSVAAPT